MASNVLSTEGSRQFKYTTTGAVTVGPSALIIAGATPMVPLESATGAGVTITCQVGGEATLTRKPGTAFAQGSRVFYVATGGVNKVTGTAAAGKMIGYSLAATTTGATTANIGLITGVMPIETAT